MSVFNPVEVLFALLAAGFTLQARQLIKEIRELRTRIRHYRWACRELFLQTAERLTRESDMVEKAKLLVEAFKAYIACTVESERQVFGPEERGLISRIVLNQLAFGLYLEGLCASRSLVDPLFMSILGSIFAHGVAISFFLTIFSSLLRPEDDA